MFLKRGGGDKLFFKKKIGAKCYILTVLFHNIFPQNIGSGSKLLLRDLKKYLKKKGRMVVP